MVAHFPGLQTTITLLSCLDGLHCRLIPLCTRKVRNNHSVYALSQEGRDTHTSLCSPLLLMFHRATAYVGVAPT
ncbi:hypothetical protein BDZ45DRAFT_674241 [Acephala macrosclerotiorum]|nr:hypothetical protein BDZ45DRAFT_674241 [Acephala macrosclerotiorum]